MADLKREEELAYVLVSIVRDMAGRRVEDCIPELAMWIKTVRDEAIDDEERSATTRCGDLNPKKYAGVPPLACGRLPGHAGAHTAFLPDYAHETRHAVHWGTEAEEAEGQSNALEARAAAQGEEK